MCIRDSLTAGVRSAKETVGETHATLEGLVGTVDDTRTSVARADDTLAGLQDCLLYTSRCV